MRKPRDAPCTNSRYAGRRTKISGRTTKRKSNNVIISVATIDSPTNHAIRSFSRGVVIIVTGGGDLIKRFFFEGCRAATLRKKVVRLLPISNLGGLLDVENCQNIADSGAIRRRDLEY